MKGMRMRFGTGKRAILLLPLLALWFGLTFATPAYAAVVENRSVPIDLVAFVPCANGGAGELVHLSGQLHELIASTTNAQGLFSFHILDSPHHVTGVGLATGLIYQGTGQTQDHFISHVKGGFTETFVNVFNVIGRGPASNFKVHETFHVTVNANGTLTTVVDNFFTTCK